MKLITSSFNNFRCFKQYDIHYGKTTTVFIGKNGTGKSSILSGIRRGLSFIFAKHKTFPNNLAISNNSKIKSFGGLEANFDTLSRSYNYPIENSFKGHFNDMDINWSLLKTKMNGGLSTTLYNEALKSILAYYSQNNLSELPLLAVFSDSFPHEKINIGTKEKQIIYQDVLPRDFGYFAWDERTNCIELWLSRFFKVSNYEKDLKREVESIERQIYWWEAKFKDAEENDDSRLNAIHGNISKLRERQICLQRDSNEKRFYNEHLFIENKIIEFTKPLYDEYNFINSEFELYRVAVNTPDMKNFTLEFSFKDGRVIAFEKLPMGYKRVFSMVIDLAYRSYILNEGTESSGIVLIDEIELHLHPTLQQEILQRLQKTFPKLQFIVTTHSPLVISNFKSDENNKIIKLEHHGDIYSNIEVENIYGIDYITSLMEVMDSTYRPSTIDKLIDMYVALKARKKEQEAILIYEKLKNILNGDPNRYIKEEIENKLSSYQ